jgi:hypothetical protein
VLDDPGQGLCVASAVVGEGAGSDHRAAGIGDLDLMSVAVGVGADDGIDEL